MTTAEIRTLVAHAVEDAGHDATDECSSGTSAHLALLGEIAAQLADFNQNFCELKHQITQGYVNVRPR